jgi:hypothetical protein
MWEVECETGTAHTSNIFPCAAHCHLNTVPEAVIHQC